MPQDIKKIERGIRRRVMSGVEMPKEKPEQAPEKFVKSKKVKIQEKPEISAPTQTAKKITKPTLASPKDDLTLQIEKVLEEDLEEVYFDMPPLKQKEFKEKGEEAAAGIRNLMESVSIKIREVIKIITNWLRVVPGVNKFFIEQEAKIKADKILNIRDPK